MSFSSPMDDDAAQRSFEEFFTDFDVNQLWDETNSCDTMLLDNCDLWHCPDPLDEEDEEDSRHSHSTFNHEPNDDCIVGGDCRIDDDNIGNLTLSHDLRHHSDSDSGVSGSCSNGQDSSGQVSLVKEVLLMNPFNNKTSTTVAPAAAIVVSSSNSTTPAILTPLKTFTTSNGVKTIVISNASRGASTTSATAVVVNNAKFSSSSLSPHPLPTPPAAPSSLRMSTATTKPSSIFEFSSSFQGTSPTAATTFLSSSTIFSPTQCNFSNNQIISSSSTAAAASNAIALQQPPVKIQPKSKSSFYSDSSTTITMFDSSPIHLHSQQQQQNHSHSTTAAAITPFQIAVVQNNSHLPKQTIVSDSKQPQQQQHNIRRGGHHHHSTTTTSATNNIGFNGGNLNNHNSLSSSASLNGASAAAMDPYSTDLNQIERLVKRQEKMIKNRQAASLSRQRKKEYLDRLEKTLEELRDENNLLRHQNLEWQSRYLELETTYKEKYSRPIKQEYGIAGSGGGVDDNGIDSSNNRKSPQGKMTVNRTKTYRFSPIGSPRQGGGGPSKSTIAASSVFFTMACIFLLNWWSPLPVSLRTSNNHLLQTAFLSPTSHHLSRELLSIESLEKDSLTLKQQIEQEENNNTRLAYCLKQLSSQAKLQHQVGTPSNEETNSSWLNSSRLSLELSNILSRHDVASKRLQFLQKNRKKSRLSPPSVLFSSTSSSYKTKIDAENNRRFDILSSSSSSSLASPLEVYKRHPSNYWEPNLEHFLPISERQNDTFYLISLSRNHLVQPALVNHTQGTRPKITFLIPMDTGGGGGQQQAGGGGRGSATNKVSVMHIQCEVVNFTMIEVDKWPNMQHLHDWHIFNP